MKYSLFLRDLLSIQIADVCGGRSSVGQCLGDAVRLLALALVPSTRMELISTAVPWPREFRADFSLFMSSLQIM
jgi:hypothetical protein